MATALMVALAVVSSPGCHQSYQNFEDAEADGHVDAEVVHDADTEGDVRVDADAESDEGGDVDVVRDATDADADADVEADADADGDASVCDGAWQDPITGYLWEIPPPYMSMNWDDAVAHCNGLVLCGYPAGSWHLPTISELRSFIRGCPDTMTGGACGVTDSCLDYDLCWGSACRSCLLSGGPGPEGCYWDRPLMCPHGRYGRRLL